MHNPGGPKADAERHPPVPPWPGVPAGDTRVSRKASIANLPRPQPATSCRLAQISIDLGIVSPAVECSEASCFQDPLTCFIALSDEIQQPITVYPCSTRLGDTEQMSASSCLSCICCLLNEAFCAGTLTQSSIVSCTKWTG